MWQGPRFGRLLALIAVLAALIGCANDLSSPNQNDPRDARPIAPAAQGPPQQGPRLRLPNRTIASDGLLI